MSGGTAQRIENGVDAAASLLLTCAMLFSMWKLGLPLLLATGWAVLTFLLCFWLLARVDARRGRFPARGFAPAAFQPEPPELMLDDILANVGQDSQVVRLFDASGTPQAAPPDASDALFEALARLRRSLR